MSVLIVCRSVWKTGQDSCRVIKQRLGDMVQGIKIFLDVDDLEDIGDLEGYITRSEVVLVYLSAAYTSSKNVSHQWNLALHCVVVSD